MANPGSNPNQHDAERSKDAELAPHSTTEREQSTLQSTLGLRLAMQSPDLQRPANNVMARQKQHGRSGASRTATASTTASTSNIHPSYASFPSQYSSRTPSTQPSQPSLQSHTQPRTAFLPAPTASQDVRGYERVTSVAPAPKRPLWSLGSTLPRVRRIPVRPAKTAYPTPGSRSNIVQQPLVMLPMQTSAPRASDYTEASGSATAQVSSDSPGGPEELVRGRDFADTTENDNYTATDFAHEGRHSGELRTSSEGSDLTSLVTGDLPPIVEGEALPTNQSSLPQSEPSQPMARPRLGYSFSSPTAAANSNPIQLLGADQLGLGRIAKQDQNPLAHVQVRESRSNRRSTDEHEIASLDPQRRLSAARKQLVQEAQHGEHLLATQGSAIDPNDCEDENAQHPTHKHIKTSSMPFLPSQGFDIMLAASSHKGADELHNRPQDRKKARSDSQNRSALEQARHPGLSGARPTPRGRAAGGPAAGVDVRKPSSQSIRRATNATNQARSAAGYFDDDVPLHQLTHLERQCSSRHRRASQQSQQAEQHHLEASTSPKPSDSHRSSNRNDTRSPSISQRIPSQAGMQKPSEEPSGRDGNEGKEASLQQSMQTKSAQVVEGAAGQERHSEETVYSCLGNDIGHTSQRSHFAGQGGEQDQGWEAEQKEYVQQDDEMWLGGQGIYEDGSIAFPTIWSRWRYHSREFLAESLATMLLITVGTAVDCQVTLSQSIGESAGSYPNQNWAWGIAVASTIYLSGGRSGAHCNPAITLALAVFRGFPWIQVPIYWSAQLLGSILGAAITYGIYLPAIDQFEGGPRVRTLTGDTGTGRLFVTVPQLVFTPASGFGTELVATSILMAMVLAVGDETNAPPSDGLSALVLGFVVVMIGMSFGWPTSYAISPSRDLGPRLFLYMVGYGKELWTHNSYWWIYGPQAGCFTGALMGALLYDLAIFTGEESPINYTRQGWKQSTPARLGSRLLNSAERLEFWTSPVRRVRRGQAAGQDEGKEGDAASYSLADKRAMAHSKSHNAILGMKSSSDGAKAGAGLLQDPTSGAIKGQRRRPSQASQQLDAQEQGCAEGCDPARC